GRGAARLSLLGFCAAGAGARGHSLPSGVEQLRRVPRLSERRMVAERVVVLLPLRARGEDADRDARARRSRNVDDRATAIRNTRRLVARGAAARTAVRALVPLREGLRHPLPAPGVSVLAAARRPRRRRA